MIPSTPQCWATLLLLVAAQSFPTSTSFLLHPTKTSTTTRTTTVQSPYRPSTRLVHVTLSQRRKSERWRCKTAGSSSFWERIRLLNAANSVGEAPDVEEEGNNDVTSIMDSHTSPALVEDKLNVGIVEIHSNTSEAIEDSTKEGAQQSILETGDEQALLIMSEDRLHQETNTTDKNDSQSEVGGKGILVSVEAPPICRIVTRAGSRLPTNPKVLPHSLYQSPFLLDKLDAYYHAKSRQITQGLLLQHGSSENLLAGSASSTAWKNATNEGIAVVDNENEGRVVSVLRSSLEDSGFELLSRRDLDLCESLNAGYLLRLSILPDVSELDPSLYREFYPDRCDNNSNENTDDDEKPLFEGRVLVYWRGYSQEVTRGRLFLPKIDYLQASLVQRSAAWVKNKLDRVEMELWKSTLTQSRKARRLLWRWIYRLIDSIRIKQLAKLIRASNLDENAVVVSADDEGNPSNDANFEVSRRRSFKLSRYGGSKIKFVGSPNPSDALDPFIICEANYMDPSPMPNEREKYMERLGATASQQPSNSTTIHAMVEHDLYKEVNHKAYTCEYDATVLKRNRRKGTPSELPRMKLLERVSISNLVDVFTRSGRRELIKALFSKSELVEPTYEEVIVIWRPLPKEEKGMAPPMIVSELADMFDVEGFDQPDESIVEIQRGKLEIRNFEKVPMSNLPAVLPKTKLVFRPADAFLFDMISFVTFSLVVSSFKFDSTRLDLLALVSVVLWVFRTIFRYSNKLARYDLLVKTFLTSKISQRNGGALKYLAYEAGSQRAIRTALVHSWALHAYKIAYSPLQRQGDGGLLTRSYLEDNCATEINRLLNTDEEVQLNPSRAIQELVDLRLLRLAEDGEIVLRVNDISSSTEEIKQLWMELLETRNILKSLPSTLNEYSPSNGPSSGEEISSTVMQDAMGDKETADTAAAEISFDETRLSASIGKTWFGVRDWQERRKALTSALDESQRMGLSKAKEYIREKKPIHSIKKALKRFDEIDSSQRIHSQPPEDSTK